MSVCVCVYLDRADWLQQLEHLISDSLTANEGGH